MPAQIHAVTVTFLNQIPRGTISCFMNKISPPLCSWQSKSSSRQIPDSPAKTTATMPTAIPPPPDPPLPPLPVVDQSDEPILSRNDIGWTDYTAVFVAASSVVDNLVAAVEARSTTIIPDASSGSAVSAAHQLAQSCVQNIAGNTIDLAKIDFANQKSIRHNIPYFSGRGRRDYPLTLLKRLATPEAKLSFCQRWRNMTMSQQVASKTRFKESLKAENARKKAANQRKMAAQKRETVRRNAEKNNAKKAVQAEKKRKKEEERPEKERERAIRKQGNRKKKRREDSAAADAENEKENEVCVCDLLLLLLCVYHIISVSHLIISVYHSLSQDS